MPCDGLRYNLRYLADLGLGHVPQELQREMDALRSNGPQSFDTRIPESPRRLSQGPLDLIRQIDRHKGPQFALRWVLTLRRLPYLP